MLAKKQVLKLCRVIYNDINSRVSIKVVRGACNDNNQKAGIEAILREMDNKSISLMNFEDQ